MEECPRETLRAYFTTGHNASSAAAALGVARHTVKNRLRTVERTIDRSLHTCLPELEVALRLEEVDAAPAMRTVCRSGNLFSMLEMSTPWRRTDVGGSMWPLLSGAFDHIGIARVGLILISLTRYFRHGRWGRPGNGSAYKGGRDDPPSGCVVEQRDGRWFLFLRGT